MKKYIISILMIFCVDIIVRYIKSALIHVKIQRYNKSIIGSIRYVPQGSGGVEFGGDLGLLKVGESCQIKSNSYFDCSGGISIGDYFHTGRGLTIFSTSHNWNKASKLPYDDEFIPKPVSIGNYVWLGANVTILPGTSIGNGVIVSAGSVVRGNIPDNVVIAGNPAEVVSYRDKEHVDKLVAHGSFF
ncbi:acyltransferase [Vibrio cyclitrophicus]|uniref:acyltransferase n=1 Tax=Vibrio cyclitrophicus TaxID=47951 RepID=UPI000366C712|nr:acyltransferase [Vibrio cyclitrophicus]